MALRQMAIVQAKSERARINLATYMGGSTFVYIENKREDGRIFVSSEYTREYWFWIDPPDDPNWDYMEVKEGEVVSE